MTARLMAMVFYVPRACLPPKRRRILMIPIGASLLFGALSHAISGNRAAAFAEVADAGLFGLVLPLGTLIIGDAVLGAEVRSGALPFTWLSPVMLREIIVARWIGGWLIALATIVPACGVAAIIAGVPEAIAPLMLSMAFGAAALVAIFVLIGSTTQRAAVWSLAVVLLGERLLGAAIAGVAGISPSWVARSVYASYGPVADSLERSGIPSGGAALGRLLLITLVALAASVWRLGSLRLTGSRD